MPDGSVFARVHVLVICDEIEELPDAEDLITLSGVRTQIQAPSFPYVHPLLCIYLQVTGHQGTASGHLLVVNEATQEEVFYRPIEEFQLFGPLEIIPIWMRVWDCEFPEPGVYWFQVYLNGKLIQERRFRLVASPGGSNGQPTR
jgi:hypothetical protein